MATDTTANLALPYIAAAQAQKHITHNEALRMLDAIVHVGVIDKDLATPPASPAESARYIVPAGATGVWSGQTGRIAAYQNGAWAFFAAKAGWLAWVADESRLYAFTGSAWAIAGPGSINPAGMVGVNTTADSTNRLAVKSNAVLISHDDVTPGSGDIRVVYNKAASARTASFMFQNNYSGRAEVGLTGDDKLSFKVSADGSTWTNSLILDGSGTVGIGASPAVASNALYVEKPFSVVSQFVNSAAPGGAGGAGMAGYTRDTPVAGGDRLGFLIFGSLGGGASSANAVAITGMADAAWTLGSSTPASLRFETTPGGSAARAERLRVEAAGHTRPGADNAYTLGSSAFRWSTVYAATGTINTSDERLKTDVEDCPLGLEFIQSLRPVLYRWKSGSSHITYSVRHNPHYDPSMPGEEFAEEIHESEAVPHLGRRRHTGLLAQDVKAALDAAGVDCGLWVLDDKNDLGSAQSLRYDQFIAPLVRAVQQLTARVERLESS